MRDRTSDVHALMFAAAAHACFWSSGDLRITVEMARIGCQYEMRPPQLELPLVASEPVTASDPVMAAD